MLEPALTHQMESGPAKIERFDQGMSRLKVSLPAGADYLTHPGLASAPGPVSHYSLPNKEKYSFRLEGLNLHDCLTLKSLIEYSQHLTVVIICNFESGPPPELGLIQGGTPKPVEYIRVFVSTGTVSWYGKM